MLVLKIVESKWKSLYSNLISIVCKSLIAVSVATNAKCKITLTSGHCTGYTITRVLFYSQLMNIIIVANLTRAMPVEENADYFKQESVGV